MPQVSCPGAHCVSASLSTPWDSPGDPQEGCSQSQLQRGPAVCRHLGEPLDSCGPGRIRRWLGTLQPRGGSSVCGGHCEGLAHRG